MKNKLLLSIITLGMFFVSILSVNANSISEINMDVYIDKSGNAEVVETWNAYLTQGTEGYRAFSNLGNSVISDFTVVDDTGREYESLPYWYTSNSFDQKAYKSGIHRINGGLELCWGISKYGERGYTLKYKISNLVTQYTDTQGIYFNFLNLNQSVEEANINIHSDIPFSLDNARIWAFGNNGSINFKDNNIVYKGGYLSSSDYMVALVRFESNLFDTENKSYKSFDDIYDSAFSDVVESSDAVEVEGTEPRKPRTVLDIIKSIIGFIVMLPFNPLIWCIGIILYFKRKDKIASGNHLYSGKLSFGPEGKTLPKDSDINYWREIPCDKDLEEAYWLSTNYYIVTEKKLKEGIIGAILLRWIKNGYITITETKKGLFSVKDNNYALDFTKMESGDTEIENALFKMLVDASRSNKILEAKEFSKWSKRHYDKISSWFNSIIYKTEPRLEEKGLITKTEEMGKGLFGRPKTITKRHVSPELREEAIHLSGLKKFLLEFSQIPKRKAIEVHLWEDYLIFAHLLGIADKVEEQFSKLYPKIYEESVLTTDFTTVIARDMADICYEGMRVGQERAAARASSDHDYSGSSSSSGGGGSSYSSGGSSSGGSSGGGFR